MMDRTELQHILADLPLGPMRYYPQIGSTNAIAMSWVGEDAPDLALVVADEQTQGRGRLGRQWFTPVGAALAFSLIFRLFGPIDQPRLFARLTGLGSLAVADALIQDLKLPVEIKWPNDVLIRRRKTAGILVEAAWQGDQLLAVILGIGVNVTRDSVPQSEPLLFPATCIEAEANQPVDRWRLLHTILANLLQRKVQIDDPKFLQDWQNRLAFNGERVQITEAGQVRLGKILGLNEDGSLRLRINTGEVISIYNGDVRLRPLE